jgi:ferrous iron transport protein A
MSSPIPLSELAVGERAVVVEVALAGAYGRRLEDLGFAPETEVTCRRRAPLGDPRVYEVCGIQLCLRSREAAAIRVRRT